MGYGYWKHDMHEREAVFNLYFRKNPFNGHYTIAAGLDTLIEFVEGFCITEDDTNYLASLFGNDGKPLFDKKYLAYLEGMRFTGNISAIPEGTVVFPNEPLVQVKAPLIQAQWLETAFLNIINFQTLIATKAHRICRTAEGPVLEFGLRRAQGIDGGLAASRAAYVGGVAATSNVLAGKQYGIPVKGTHAHSWVMSFDSEKEAFSAYAEAMPNNSVMLVDTYNTIKGVRAAIDIGHTLRAQGAELAGVRLDSGDMAELSKTARAMLNEAGFPNALIVASNDLNERSIARLKADGACIDLWGVGTKLVTAYDQPALGGVYKLASIQDAKGEWHNKIKLSSTPEKSSNPGAQNVMRYYYLDDDKNWIAFADVIYEDKVGPQFIAEPDNHTTQEGFREQSLLRRVFRGGELVYNCPTLEEIRDHRQRSCDSVQVSHPNIRKYQVGLDYNLQTQKAKLTTELREQQ